MRRWGREVRECEIRMLFTRISREGHSEPAARTGCGSPSEDECLSPAVRADCSPSSRRFVCSGHLSEHGPIRHSPGGGREGDCWAVGVAPPAGARGGNRCFRVPLPNGPSTASGEDLVSSRVLVWSTCVNETAVKGCAARDVEDIRREKIVSKSEVIHKRWTRGRVLDGAQPMDGEAA